MIRAAIAAVVVLVLAGLAIAWFVGRPVEHHDSVAPTVIEATVPPTVVTTTTKTVISPRWLRTTSEATGIPSIALDAYAVAASAQAAVTPSCGLGWNTLAGLGYAESAHGTIDGAHLDPATGQLVGSILGPVLDGGKYDVVRDTDAGALDGDTTYDRAVGPLQFLPATWSSYGVDGNADGAADPDNIFDAARSAAAYLCASGRGLKSGDAWEAAIRSYNPNDSYVTEVLAAANSYAKH